jgi:hypothetical protein
MVMNLDGKRVISVYDPEAHTLTWQGREPMAKGRHIIEIIVKDRSGNIASKSHHFYIQ